MKEDIYYVSPTKSAPFYITIAGVSYCDGSYHVRRRNSSVICIEYILEGTGTIVTPDTLYHPSKRDIYMLTKGKNHEYYSDAKNPWTKIWFNAGGSLVETLVASYHLEDNILFHNATKAEVDCFYEIINLCKSSLDPSATNAQCALIFHKLLQYLHQSTTIDDAITNPDAAFVKHYIDTHLESQIKLDSLSSQVFKSTSQVIRMFYKEYGITPYNYLLQQRMKLSRILLKSTKLSIKEIAYRTGYTDEHYFCKVFKDNSNFTPSDYRRQNQ